MVDVERWQGSEVVSWKETGDDTTKRIKMQKIEIKESNYNQKIEKRE